MTDATLNEELAALDRPALLARWTAAFGAPPPKAFYGARLIRGIAYRQQVEANPELQRLEQTLAKRLRTTKPASPRRRHVRLHLGARLLRDWGGETHEVTVTEAGFRYRRRLYKSLSAIARKITGSRWSGPAFFGLTP